MAFVAAGTVLNTVAATGAVNIPSHSNGDILVLWCGMTQGSTSPGVNILTPGGALTWTARPTAEAGNASAVRLACFTAVGDGVETSVTVDADGGTGNPRYTAQVQAFSGRNGTIETVSSTTQESGTNIDSPSITPSTADADISRAYVFDDDISTSANHDQNANFKGTSSGYGEGATPGNGQAAAFSHQAGQPASATGTSTWQSNGDSDAGVAGTIALLATDPAPPPGIGRLDAATSAAAATLSFPVSAGSGRMLVACFSHEFNGQTAVSSVDYGGQAMVQAVQQDTPDAGFSAGCSIWYLLDAGIVAASTSTITPTYSLAPADEIIHAASYKGVDQTGGSTTNPATSSAESNEATPNPLILDLTETDKGLVIAAIAAGNASSASWASAMTEQTDQTDASSYSSMADRLSSTSANVDIEPTTASQNRAAGVAATFAPAPEPFPPWPRRQLTTVRM